VGLRRPRNEDAAAAVAADGWSAAAVCDGVASTGNAHLAARAAADVAIDVVRRGAGGTADPEGATALLVGAFAAAQQAVSGVGAEGTGSLELAPSTTMVAALVVAGTVVVASIGDSRAYWIGATGPATLLTTDDSLAQDRMAEGTPSAVAFADPDAHTITRWLGADADGGAPAVTSVPVTGPGWVVLCTDGLWNYVEAPDRLAEAAGDLAGIRPAEVARRLVRVALAAGGQDNVTVAVLAVGTPDGDHDGPDRQ
jgi:serine/threonine protein phosphatase PrpC